jgi:hypothetical protein
MALQDVFQVQIDQLRSFMRHSQQSLRCIRVAPDIKQILIKALSGLDDDPNSPYVMIGADIPFRTPVQFFEELSAQVLEDYELHRAELEALGAHPRFPPRDGAVVSAPKNYVRAVTGLAESLPPAIRSLVVVLSPESIDDGPAYRAAMDTLAEEARSKRVKHIVLDTREDPALGDIAERCPHASIQEFHFAPNALQAQLKADLLNPQSLSRFEVRQYTALLASFCFAHKEYAECLVLQRQCFDMIEREGSPPESANALYNMGNTHLALGDLSEAEVCYARSVDLCVDHELNSLMPMVLTNLGIVLYRQKRLQDSTRSFQIARDVARNQKQRTTEAHVLDCMAKVCADDGKYAGAERYWLEALALYDGITSEFFVDVRESGRADILGKLELHYQSTEQPTKLAEVKRQKGA